MPSIINDGRDDLEPRGSENPPSDNLPEIPPGHWRLFRDLAGFQLKLLLDAVRDLMLSPISIIAVLTGVFSRQDNPGKHFYALMKIGHKTDRWINLFGTGEEDNPSTSSDVYLRKMEKIIVKEYEKGGVIKQAKDKTDGLIGKIRKD